jgi:hypothetical protein
MIRQIITIFVLLLALAGISYYGFTLYKSGGISSAVLDQELAFFDGTLSEMDAFAPTETELLEIEELKQQMDEEDNRPVTTSELDTLLKDIDTVTKGTYSDMNITLTDI